MPISDQGVTLDRYMFVPRTLIFLTKGDQLLLLKGAETKRLWAGLFNGIGGHVEPGEDIYSAAQREIFEETGLNPLALYLCGVFTVDTQTNPGVCVFIFTGECKESELKASQEGNLDWHPVSELVTLALVSDLHILLPKVLSYKPGMPVFFAHSRYDDLGNVSLEFNQSINQE
jgi:8-oxo-dGTP diphosphatase